VLMPLGSMGWPVVLEVAAVSLVILWAPLSTRWIGPIALALLGLGGVLLDVSTSRAARAVAVAGPNGGFTGGLGTDGRAIAWGTVLLLQSLVLLAVGAWLIWANDRRLVRLGAGSRATLARWARPRALALLFPVATFLLVLLVDHTVSHAAWVSAGVTAGLALLVASLFPAVGADLAAVAVIVLALWGTVDATAPPPETLARVSGDGLASLATLGPSGDWRLALLGAAEAGTILAFGMWLVPRTIVPHARALLHIEPDPVLAGRVQQLTRTRADAADTAAAELRRVERDLHDGAQARLVALGMNLRAAERLIATSPEAAIELVAEARETSSKALTELRDLVRGIYPPVLADRGLGDAVKALALDTPLRVDTDIDLPGRLDAPVESACYFAVAEALTNAVRHSGARQAHIRLRFAPDQPRSRPSGGRPVPGVLRIEVTDNGIGGADPARGSGLHGVERRLATFDGILAVSSPPGGPTMIIMEVPCALSSRKTSTS
jgi:signal transduction histidine kinase